MYNKFAEQARKHNKSINDYMETLKAEYGEKTSISNWFEINEKIRQQNFYEKGIAIVHEARANGFDFKMDMQDNKICVPSGYGYKNF